MNVRAGQDYIYSEQAVGYAEELRDQIEFIQEDIDNGDGNESQLSCEILDLETEAEDWESFAEELNGETAIHEDEFPTYAEQMVRECYHEVDWNAWPYKCIDWKDVADELMLDYTDFDLQGETYYAIA